MKINELILIVNNFYNKLYKEEAIEILKISEYIFELKFSSEVIKVDKSVGNKYRLYFSNIEGVVDEFRLLIDEALKFKMYTCDTSNFIDLTGAQINEIILYYNYK